MLMNSKLVMLPDLVIEEAEYTGGPGGGLQVRNVGQVAAGPSHFHYECHSDDASVSCGKAFEDHQPQLSLDVPVPGLSPGQAILVKGSTPGTMQYPGNIKLPMALVRWSATADHQKEVAESNESNNQVKGGK